MLQSSNYVVANMMSTLNNSYINSVDIAYDSVYRIIIRGSKKSAVSLIDFSL